MSESKKEAKDEEFDMFDDDVPFVYLNVYLFFVLDFRGATSAFNTRQLQDQVCLRKHSDAECR